MAWSRGPGAISSININSGAPTVESGYIENYSLSTEPETFDSAGGFTGERGYVAKRGNFIVTDYSAVASLNTLMQNGTLVPIIYTYVDAATQTVTSNRIRIKPVVNLVPDACRIYAAVAGTTKTNLAATWTDLGPIIGSMDLNFDYPFDGADGCGRPYFSTGRLTGTLTLVGDSSVTDPYTAFTGASLRGVKCDIAVTLPSGNFLVFDDVWSYITYADEDSNTPRAARVMFTGVYGNWTAAISYTDGAASGTATDAWGTTTNSLDPGDWFAGCEVEAVGVGYAETDFVSFA